MSKMEEKLKESIKPRQPAREKPKSSAPKKAVVKEVDLNAPDNPLHPNRIWPD